MRNFAIILSGSGVFDGSEIHEATLTMLAIRESDFNYQCFAPDLDQYHVIDHFSGETLNERRNVLVESARIARGDIKPLDQLDVADFDAVFIPGGFGVAKNLSNYAFEGVDMSVISLVRSVIEEFYNSKKPIAALCISPVIVAKILPGVSVTIGTDEKTSSDIETLKGEHIISGHADVIIDEDFKVVTTPCYMLDADITDIAKGTRAVVYAVEELLKG